MLEEKVRAASVRGRRFLVTLAALSGLDRFYRDRSWRRELPIEPTALPLRVKYFFDFLFVLEFCRTRKKKFVVLALNSISSALNPKTAAVVNYARRV